MIPVLSQRVLFDEGWGVFGREQPRQRLLSGGIRIRKESMLVLQFSENSVRCPTAFPFGLVFYKSNYRPEATSMLQSLKRIFSQSTTTGSHRRQNNRLTSEPVEALEVRALLAGNVLVSLNASGNLTLKGDNFSNAVRVDPVPGGIKVTGLPDEIDGLPTTLGNGQTERVFAGDQFVGGNLKVQMKGGNDEVFSTVDVKKNVSINMGKGADILEVTGATIDGNAKLNLGASGPEEIAAVILSDVVVAGNAVLKGGGGSQIAYIEDSSFPKKISVNLGGGNDVLDIADTTFNAFKFNGGSGNDLFLLSPDGSSTVKSNGFEIFDDI